jgi:hypothetical protein
LQPDHFTGGNLGGGSPIVYTYSATETGTYTSTVPSALGTHWVKATVAETTNYLGGTSTPVSFDILGGTAKVIINAWVAEHQIATDKGATHTLHRNAGDSHVINVTDSGYGTSYEWSVNSVTTTTGVTNGGATYTFNAAGKDNGTYNIELEVKKGGVPYSTLFTVTVTN